MAMNECEMAIASGNKLKMLAYLEGKEVEIWHRRHIVENGRAAGFCLIYYDIGMLEQFCREAQASIGEKNVL